MLFRVAEIKVIADVIGEDGEPTGEQVEVIDMSKVLFERVAIGQEGHMESLLVEADGESDAKWVVTSITCE